MNYEKLLLTCLTTLQKKANFNPVVGIVLGSGLGGFADKVENPIIVPYNEIKNFPCSTVQGHKGQFVFGYINGVPVVAMSGRVHYYEGYEMGQVVLPVRLMGLMGVKCVILTNASGGISDNLDAGDVMLITDHISSFVPSPLIGKNFDFLGERFPDMTSVYDKTLNKYFKNVASKQNINLKQGVFIQLTGPQYETPAEIKMIASLGGDAVAMSTAVEAIALRHMGVKVCGFSCICNKAAGLSSGALSHDDVQQVAQTAGKTLEMLLLNGICDEFVNLMR